MSSSNQWDCLNSDISIMSSFSTSQAIKMRSISARMKDRQLQKWCRMGKPLFQPFQPEGFKLVPCSKLSLMSMNDEVTLVAWMLAQNWIRMDPPLLSYNLKWSRWCFIHDYFLKWLENYIIIWFVFLEMTLRVIMSKHGYQFSCQHRIG
jgi:hypothetical protein